MPLFIGLMSGTSMDGIDAALVSLSDGKFEVISTHVATYPEALRSELAELVRTPVSAADRYWRADASVGRCFGAAALSLLESTGVDPGAVTAIGSHGQTVHHAPNEPIPFTVQLGDPNIIAEMTGITTVADFRRRDIAAGGQGAPLAPAFHQAVFASTSAARGILNIGGIGNLTVLDVDGRTAFGFDTGPGNTLLDGYARAELEVPMDLDARMAAQGEVVAPLLHSMLGDPFFERKPPKSTGLEYFHRDWLDEHLSRSQCRATVPDVLRTLSALTVEATARALESHAPQISEIYVCGGGASNPLLMRELRARLPGVKVATTDSLGVAPDWVEAIAFAWLAKQTLDGQAGNLPEVTGATGSRILGGVYHA